MRSYIFLRKVKLPGCKGVGLYDIARFFFRDIFSPRFNTMAASIAYNFFFSLIPMMILLFLLIPYIPIPKLKQQILNYAAQNIPNISMNLVSKLVNDVFKKMGLEWIVVNIVLILFSSLRGILALMRAFQRPDKPNLRQNIFSLYGRALLMLIILFVFLIMSTVVLGIGDYLIDFGTKYIKIKGIDALGLRIMNYGITFALLLFSLTMVYLLGSDSRSRWKFFSPGSVLAAGLLLLTLRLLNYYFAHFGNFNKIYGSLVAVVLLMLWFYYIGMVIIIGNSINQSIDKVLDIKENKLHAGTFEMPADEEL